MVGKTVCTLAQIKAVVSIITLFTTTDPRGWRELVSFKNILHEVEKTINFLKPQALVTGLFYMLRDKMGSSQKHFCC